MESGRHLILCLFLYMSPPYFMTKGIRISVVIYNIRFIVIYNYVFGLCQFFFLKKKKKQMNLQYSTSVLQELLFCVKKQQPATTNMFL